MNNDVISATSSFLPIHQSIKQRLDRFIYNNRIPHIIFHGISGSGKLTLVKDFIHRIYHGDRNKLKSLVMIVNCSHGKGIQFIRDEIKFFAKTNISTKSGTEFKTIVLLNAHHLTADAQSALRRCIELFSYNTRFFIVVENKNKLLTPILSRFCEIYVPEHEEPCVGNSVSTGASSSSSTSTGSSTSTSTPMPINLHTYTLNRTCPFRKEIRDRQNAIIDGILSRTDTTNVVVLPNQLYEAGISCLDLIEWITMKKEMYLTEVEYAQMMLHFHTIKTEFRCEKLLMLRILTSILCK